LDGLLSDAFDVCGVAARASPGVAGVGADPDELPTRSGVGASTWSGVSKPAADESM